MTPSAPLRMRPIRTAARALIVHEGRMLAIKMQDERGIFYILPGGGQDPGETLPVALERECLEEIGARVKVGELAYVREYIGRNHGFSKSHRAFHQVEHVFHCELLGGLDQSQASEQDRKQVGVAWLPLEDLSALPFYPEALKAYVEDGQIKVAPLYMGDIN